MNRRQTIQRLASLLTELGWVCQEFDGADLKCTVDNEKVLKCHFLSAPKTGGITVMSHSKYVIKLTV